MATATETRAIRDGRCPWCRRYVRLNRLFDTPEAAAAWQPDFWHKKCIEEAERLEREATGE